MARYVRKETEDCDEGVFWIDSQDDVCWWDRPDYVNEIANDGGYLAEEEDAAKFGTTLAKIRAELT